MRLGVTNLKRLSSILVLFASIGGLMISGFQDASAMPGPDRFWKGQVAQDGLQLVELDGLATFFPHLGSIWITEPGVTPTFPTSGFPGGAFSIPCVVTFAGAGAVWELRNITTASTALWSLPALIDGLDFQFRGGQAGAGAANGGGIPINAGIMIGAGAGNTYAWVNIQGPANAKNNLVGPGWNIVICGHDNTNLSPPAEFTDTFQYRVLIPVGGEIVPINTTSLLIAGLFSNPLWVLPVFAAIGAGAFAVLRHQVKSKKE